MNSIDENKLLSFNVKDKKGIVLKEGDIIKTYLGEEICVVRNFNDELFAEFYDYPDYIPLIDRYGNHIFCEIIGNYDNNKELVPGYQW